MKLLNRRRLATPSAMKQLMLAAPVLVYGTAALGAGIADSPQADPTPMLALYQTVDNNTEPACGLELTAIPGGLPQKLLPKKECPEVEGSVIAPHAIRIRNVPIKSTLLLTNNERCEKANSAWVELDTSRANASLEKMGIDKIWTYAGSPEKPGYLTNNGIDSNAPSRGFRVTGKGDPIKQGELACVVVTFAERGN